MAGAFSFIIIIIIILILVFLDTNEFMDNASHEDPDDDRCHVTHAINDNTGHAHAWPAFFFFFCAFLFLF